MRSRRVWTFEHGILWAMDLNRGPLKVAPKIEIVFGEARRDAADKLATAMGLSSPEPILQRFSAGNRCFAGWIDTDIATYGWVSQGTETIGELERDMRLQTGEVYIWDCATLPAYRGQRLYSALLSFIATSLHCEGLQRAWIGTAVHNKPSLLGFVNAGFQPVMMVAYMRFLRLSCLLLFGLKTAHKGLIEAACHALLRPDERGWGLIRLGWPKGANRKEGNIV